MMRRFVLGAGLAAVILACGTPTMAAERASAAAREDYVRVPMPPGFRVESTELQGPVFADANGRTLYKWPFAVLRSGQTGDQKNESRCGYEVTTLTAGMMSPYPPGMTLPELDRRKSCAQTWMPVIAADDAKPVGAWSTITRKDGKKQWAYDGSALYTSDLDTAPGDTNGTSGGGGGDTPAEREVVRPPPAMPPGFIIRSTALGRLLLTSTRATVYTYDKDGPNKSNCDAECTQTWVPVLAPMAANPQGEWTTFERAPGVLQWAFRKRPLYTYTLDLRPANLTGNDVPGWHSVYTQTGPKPPAEFTLQDSMTGVVLADRNGKTLYIYNCGDDSVDQLACDHPDAPQIYRLTVCGGGDIDLCLRNRPYVLADANAKQPSQSWSIMTIDPRTGRRAETGTPGSLRVWAYRARPVYTYAGDLKPGDMEGSDRGEYHGGRNGYLSFLLRDDFANNAR